MSFTSGTLNAVAQGFGTCPTLWVYISPDARATVEGTDYFALMGKPGANNKGMKVGDVVVVVYTTGYVTTIHAVAAVDSDGNATINAAVLS